ncbi:uncharacterized protein [Diadema antillarum]|uniref:uncharacterized protein n=1 Tax=Diadema antillarum TaxID=105358 RepID=UPI003A83EC58
MNRDCSNAVSSLRVPSTTKSTMDMLVLDLSVKPSGIKSEESSASAGNLQQLVEQNSEGSVDSRIGKKEAFAINNSKDMPLEGKMTSQRDGAQEKASPEDYLHDQSRQAKKTETIPVKLEAGLSFPESSNSAVLKGESSNPPSLWQKSQGLFQREHQFSVASPSEQRPLSTTLPILTIPKIRLRQNRSGEWDYSHPPLPSESSGLSVGGYALKGSGSGGVSSTVQYQNCSRGSRMPSRDDSTSNSSNMQEPRQNSSEDSIRQSPPQPSLLQMALQHGSSQLQSDGLPETQEGKKKRSVDRVGTCPVLPINPKNLKEAKHRNIKTRDKQYYQCQYCNIIYTQPRKLERHLKDTQGKAPYQCCYCDLSFPTIGCRRFHSQLHEDKTMPCPYCPKIFNEKRRYEDHVRSHTGEAPFMCQECGNVYRTRSALRIHKRTHANDKPLQCRFCPKRFIRIGDVQVHERTHTGEKPYKCGICPSSFATSSQVNRHRRTHSEERPHHCSYCNKTFKNPDYLITHEKMHLGHKPHHCKFCPKMFRTPRELVHHERTHTGEKPFQCNVCGHRFSKKTNLKQHELQHTGIKAFSCSKCPKSFYRKASLMWHEKIHQNRERFLCKECGKLFFKESSRDKHAKKAHGNSNGCEGTNEEQHGTEEIEKEIDQSYSQAEKNDIEESSSSSMLQNAVDKRTPSKNTVNDGTDSTCEECGKTFLARRSLLRHYRAIHNRYISRNGDGDSPKVKKHFSCRICSDTFPTDHLRHVHEASHSNLSFTCEQCNKVFSTRQLLVKHQKVHSEVKPHVCEQCGRAFTIKWYLNRHINIVHSEAYTYTCTICGKKFKAKTALSVHMQLHNVDGKIYECDQCDSEFHVKRYLARHKRKYHRKERAKPEKVGTVSPSSGGGDGEYAELLDIEEISDDGFDITTADSKSVSGVFLRQMLSTRSKLEAFDDAEEQREGYGGPSQNRNRQESPEEEKNNDGASDSHGDTRKDDSETGVGTVDDDVYKEENLGEEGKDNEKPSVNTEYEEDEDVNTSDSGTLDFQGDDKNDEDYVVEESMSDIDDI